MKIKISTTEVTEVEIKLPVYFKRWSSFYAILENGKCYRVMNEESPGISSIGVYKSSHMVSDDYKKSEPITSEEFWHVYNDALQIIQENQLETV